MSVWGHFAKLGGAVMLCAACSSPEPLQTLPVDPVSFPPFTPVETPPARLIFTASPLRPRLQALVDDLAENGGGVSGKHVGIAGKVSPTWEKAEAVASEADDDEVVALLVHPSPVVRGNMVVAIAQRRAWLSPSLQVLANDDASIRTMHGCIAGSTTVAKLVTSELCQARDASARKALEALAKKNDDARACLSTVH